MKPQNILSGYFTSEEQLISALKHLQKEKITIIDVFTPYPVHGLEKLLKIKPETLSYIAFGGGILGFIVGIGMQIVISTHLAPVVFGGKPLMAIPSFMPITTMLTLLFAVFAVVFGFFIQTGTGAGAVNRIYDPGTTNDRFLILIDANSSEAKLVFTKTNAIDIKLVD